jgi:hypothetical protein
VVGATVVETVVGATVVETVVGVVEGGGVGDDVGTTVVEAVVGATVVVAVVGATVVETVVGLVEGGDDVGTTVVEAVVGATVVEAVVGATVVEAVVGLVEGGGVGDESGVDETVEGCCVVTGRSTFVPGKEGIMVGGSCVEVLSVGEGSSSEVEELELRA